MSIFRHTKNSFHFQNCYSLLYLLEELSLRCKSCTLHLRTIQFTVPIWSHACTCTPSHMPDWSHNSHHSFCLPEAQDSNRIKKHHCFLASLCTPSDTNVCSLSINNSLDIFPRSNEGRKKECSVAATADSPSCHPQRLLQHENLQTGHGYSS